MASERKRPDDLIGGRTAEPQFCKDEVGCRATAGEFLSQNSDGLRAVAGALDSVDCHPQQMIFHNYETHFSPRDWDV